MSYNLLLNTTFEPYNWEFINCTFKNGILTSTDKVFGIVQKLVLPDPTKLYYRINYKCFSKINEVKLGIQNGSRLGINRQIPKVGKNYKISLIDLATQEQVKLHLIFESNEQINKVQIFEPILIDLNHLNKGTWLKSILDKTIKYRSGYAYNNLYCTGEIKPTLDDFKNINIEDAKIGSIIHSKENIKIPLTAKFIKGNYYLAKLDFKEINKFGKIYFKYGILESDNEINEQLYLVFKAAEDNELTLNIDANDVFDYMVNVKHLMIIDITKLHIINDDIPYLPFV